MLHLLALHKRTPAPKQLKHNAPHRAHKLFGPPVQAQEAAVENKQP
jgi:hypothetical protein